MPSKVFTFVIGMIAVLWAVQLSPIDTERGYFVAGIIVGLWTVFWADACSSPKKPESDE